MRFRRWLSVAGLAAGVVVVAACAPCSPSLPPVPDEPMYAPCRSIVCDAIGCPILPPDCP